MKLIETFKNSPKNYLPNLLIKASDAKNIMPALHIIESFSYKKNINETRVKNIISILLSLKDEFPIGTPTYKKIFSIIDKLSSKVSKETAKEFVEKYLNLLSTTITKNADDDDCDYHYKYIQILHCFNKYCSKEEQAKQIALKSIDTIMDFNYSGGYDSDDTFPTLCDASCTFIAKLSIKNQEVVLNELMSLMTKTVSFSYGVNLKYLNKIVRLLFDNLTRDILKTSMKDIISIMINSKQDRPHNFDYISNFYNKFTPDEVTDLVKPHLPENWFYISLQLMHLDQKSDSYYVLNKIMHEFMPNLLWLPKSSFDSEKEWLDSFDNLRPIENLPLIKFCMHILDSKENNTLEVIKQWRKNNTGFFMPPYRYRKPDFPKKLSNTLDNIQTELEKNKPQTDIDATSTPTTKYY